jgi:hypothetical protein
MPCRRAARLAPFLVVLALAVPAVAAAQQAPTLGAPEQTSSAPVATTTDTSGGGLATWQEGLIVAAGLVLLAGIAWAIIGDARQRAPVADRHARELEAAAAGGGKVSPHEKRRRKERARAKARAARAARKRNR